MGRPKFPSKTALFEAARRWDVTSVKTVLRAAPDLAKASDAKGRTALHIMRREPEERAAWRAHRGQDRHRDLESGCGPGD
jgi:hypothetical protein